MFQEGYDAVQNNEDPTSLLIKNREMVLKKKQAAKLPFTVTYQGDVAPKLTQFRLNARSLCPEDTD